MKRTLCLLLLLGATAFADDKLRDVQTVLKSQGFYYGDVNGQSTPETTAAIRRFQIRNGLEVTGTLTPETLGSLNIGGTKPLPRTAPAPAEKPKPQPPVNLRRDETAEESDRNFLRREEARQRAAEEAAPERVTPPAPRDPSIISPPAPLDELTIEFPVLFARTPYATAPREVQQQVLARAQAMLASRGFYREVVDGLPGPATEEAILSYQRAARLTMTARLDLETLSHLRLLPGRATTSSRQPPPRAPAQRTYRGIWVN